MKDSAQFYVIAAPRETTIKIRRSLFTCRLMPVESADQAKAFISSVSKENRTATHNCWAYILGKNAEICHSSDAGEPAGTAGKPMLQTLQSYGLTRVAAVVTRFFGGVKLGVRGLMDAYAESVRQAVEQADLKQSIALARVVIDVEYGFNDILLARISPFIHQLVATEYSQRILHTADVSLEQLELLNRLLTDFKSQGKLVFTLSSSD